jgi:hypothetical protein
MAIIDPWQKAGEFQKALKRITDPKLRTTFTEFRDLWIALANRKQFLTPAELGAEIEALGHIYSEWVSEGQDAGGMRRPAEEEAQGQPRPRPRLPMKTARIKSTNRASRIGATTQQERRADG